MHLDARVIPVTAVEGLEEFSHVWILYAFHQNTNFHKPCTSIKGKIQVWKRAVILGWRFYIMYE